MTDKAVVSEIQSVLASFHWPEDELVRVSSEMAGLHWKVDVTHVLVDIEREAQWVSRCCLHFDFCTKVRVDYALSPTLPGPGFSPEVNWPALATIAAIDCEALSDGADPATENLVRLTIRTFVGPALSFECTGFRLEWLDLPSEEQRRRADLRLV